MERSPEQLKKRERLIQLAGILLMLSPFANFFLSVYFLDTINNKWTPEGLAIIIKNGSPTHWMLWISSFIVGAAMIKGRRASWMPVLAVLGVFIIFNFWNLKKDMQRSTVRPIVLLLTNMSIFALVYSQEFHQSSQPRARKKPEPVPEPTPMPKIDPSPDIGLDLATKDIEPKESKWSLKPLSNLAASISSSISIGIKSNIPSFETQSEELPAQNPYPSHHESHPENEKQQTESMSQSKGTNSSTAAQPTKKNQTHYTDYEVHVSDLLNKVVEFEGFGPWARITEANLTELHMEAIGKTPPNIQNRRVEIVLRDKKILRLRMARQSGPKYIFVYRELTDRKSSPKSKTA